MRLTSCCNERINLPLYRQHGRDAQRDGDGVPFPLPLIAELRRHDDFLSRLGIGLQMHHLPSSLNLYADRHSHRRRQTDFLPRLVGIPNSWRVGESEHDHKPDWAKVESLRPPLVFLPLTPRKGCGNKFQGLLLIPRWPHQKWYKELVQMGVQSWELLSPATEVTPSLLKRLHASQWSKGLPPISMEPEFPQAVPQLSPVPEPRFSRPRH